MTIDKDGNLIIPTGQVDGLSSGYFNLGGTTTPYKSAEASVTDYLNKNSVSGQSYGAGAGEAAITGLPSNSVQTNNGSWFGNQDWGMSGMGGTVLGAAGLGLGVLNYLDASKTAEKNRTLMDQQIANNADTMATRLARRQGLQDTFGANSAWGKSAPAQPIQSGLTPLAK